MINPAPPVVSICVPTLRGYDRVARLLRSVEAHTPVDYEVVVVDSGSRTRGFTVPMNQALRAARGSVLIALNDDVEVTPGWIEPLVQAAREHNQTIVAPDQRSTDGDQVMCGWCVAMDRIFFERWGGYDEQFVFWCSDIDLARWVTERGHPPIRVAIPVPLRHELNGTEREDGIEQDAVEDLDRYTAKWGRSALDDKTQLRSVDWGIACAP